MTKPNPNATYEKFISCVKEVKALSSIGAVLHWDQETQMPPKGAAARAEQLGLISGLAHEKLTSDAMGEWLEDLSRQSLSDTEQVNVRETRRVYLRSKRLPTELVQEIAKTESLAHEAWVKARKASDYEAFAPWLEKMITLRKKIAGLVSGTSENGDPRVLYNTLLDEYEPGAKVEEIQPVFEHLRGELVPLVAKIRNSSKKPKRLEGKFPAEKQREFGLAVARTMGFDFDAGRLDVSAHPFCSGFNPGDVRITTRYDEGDVASALFGIMHEAGHGLYEQGFDPRYMATPMAEAVSMGIHESQSRLWENLVGRSREFWMANYSGLQDVFPVSLRSVSLEDFYFAINEVQPSLIRVEADEVTYNLHILLRFELEQALFAGNVSVSALPGEWNKKMEEYLGIRPTNDAEGVLQDIHWSMGAFGYFPTYALGNLYASQFFVAADRDLGGLKRKISQNELQPLREWLREKVHRHGMRYRASDLCKMATGEDLNAKYFSDYLNGKFGALYGV